MHCPIVDLDSDREDEITGDELDDILSDNNDESLKNNVGLPKAVDAAKDLVLINVTKLKSHGVLVADLEDAQEATPLRLLEECVTRWEGLFWSIKFLRMVQLLWLITNHCSRNEIKPSRRLYSRKITTMVLLHVSGTL